MKALQKAQDIGNHAENSLATALRIVGLVLFVLSVVGALGLWPQSSFRYEPNARDFVIPIALVFSGLIWCVVFLGFAGVVRRLDQMVWLSASPVERVKLFKIEDDFEPAAKHEGSQLSSMEIELEKNKRQSAESED